MLPTARAGRRGVAAALSAGTWAAVMRSRFALGVLVLILSLRTRFAKHRPAILLVAAWVLSRRRSPHRPTAEPPVTDPAFGD